MATYFTAPAHERLNIFFGELFREMRKASPQTHGQFLLRAEQEFQRLGYREKISAGVENILIVRFDSIGDMVLMSGFLRELRRNFPQRFGRYHGANRRLLPRTFVAKKIFRRIFAALE